MLSVGDIKNVKTPINDSDFHDIPLIPQGDSNLSPGSPAQSSVNVSPLPLACAAIPPSYSVTVSTVLTAGLICIETICKANFSSASLHLLCVSAKQRHRAALAWIGVHWFQW